MVRLSAFAFLLLLATLAACSVENVLYPVESESRELRTLHGIWNFKISPQSDQMIGFDQKWYTQRFETVSQYKSTIIYYY